MIEVRNRKGGMVIRGSGGGGKGGGGGSARTPVEYPDSAHSISYAQVLDVVSEGEIFGPAHPHEPLRDIYLDGTPIQNEDGSLNFRDAEVELRNGAINQEHVKGFPASANTHQVGVKVQSTRPWVQQISNPDLSAVRVTLVWPELVRIIDSGSKFGDRVGTRVDYAIDVATDGGSFKNVITSRVDDKAKGYARTHRVDLPAGSSWVVRVRRLTSDSSSDTLRNDMYVQSYAEVIDGKFTYPMSALAAIKVDAEQFQSVPARAYHLKGLLIRVPSNYDPETRTYSGTWDGTLKTAWSDNPAWVFYDMLTNSRYGLGDRVKQGMIDRYALYQIGAYCDQMVSDGQGGTEPRFTCNVYIQGQQDALRVIDDLASVFRGMAYWAGGQVVAVADAPSDPVYTYSNANVIDGVFEYTGADVSTRKTVALVSWNDPSDFYRAKVEVVNDDDGILRYGVRKAEVTAFGCTSRAQAQRVGLYQLYTSRVEGGAITFSVGLDGVIPQPGDIIRIADQNRAGRKIGGRIKEATAERIVFDREADISVGDKLTINLPDGSQQTRTVTEMVGVLWDGEAYWDAGSTWDGAHGKRVTVSPPFSVSPTAESVWAVDSEDLVTQLARVVSIREVDAITYQISAVEHHPDKFDAIDNGVRLEPLPVSVVPPRTQRAPANVAIAEFTTYHQGTTRTAAEITYDAPYGAMTYDVQWRRDQSDWVQVPRTGATTVRIDDIYAGTYIVRVRAINAIDVPSLWAYSEPTDLDGEVAAPPTVTHLTATGEVMAIRLEWGYPAQPSIIERAEIRASLTSSFSDSYELTTVAYPDTTYTLYGLSYSSERWFWIRLIDKNGTYGAWHPTDSGAGLYGKVDDDPGRILDYLEGQITSSQLAQSLVEELDAMLIDIDSLGIDIDALGLATEENASAIQAEATTRADADTALAQQINTVVSQANQNASAIQDEATTRADADTALAQQITNLVARIDDEVDAAVQQAAQAVATLEGDLAASWQVKTQVRSDGRVVQSGVALGAAIGEDGQSRSEILLMADTVAFLAKLDGELHSPFVFDVANDTVSLRGAYIEDLSVNGAKIEDAAINSAKFTDWVQSDTYTGGQPTINMNFRTGYFRVPGLTVSGGNTTIDRLFVTNPNIVASGDTAVTRVWISSTALHTYYIDTGVSHPGNWATASTRQYSASASVGDGNRSGNGAVGVMSATIAPMNGYYTSAPGVAYRNNRIWLRITLDMSAGQGSGLTGSINPARIRWKLVSL